MPTEATARLKRRLGVFGDLPTRIVTQLLHGVPWFLEPVLIFGWTLIFYAIAKSQRRAVAGNLRALHPAWSSWRARFGAWEVFWNFAVTYADGLRFKTQTGDIDWAVDGLTWMDELSDQKTGSIILTAHMGSYDLAAPMFSAKFKRTLYTVRAPEREKETQELRARELREFEARFPNFRSLCNQDGNLLGVELARLLSEGSIVALQGDRVVFDVTPMDVEVAPGLWMRLPKGPLFLAKATRAPAYPLVIVRDGWRRYRVIISRPIKLPARQRGGEDEAGSLWAATVLGMVLDHWRQWYVFEPLLWRVR